MGSDAGTDASYSGIESNDHEPCFIFTPALPDSNGNPARNAPLDRNKGTRNSSTTLHAAKSPKETSPFEFEPLDGNEQLRQALFQRVWNEIEKKIHSTLRAANMETLTKVIAFVQDTVVLENAKPLPTGFITTGPNLSSQKLLFEQLANSLRTAELVAVVVLRSGDATNLKAVLKQIIREGTNQVVADEDEHPAYQKGRKLLSYDLELLHRHVKSLGIQKVVVAFQDSEAFDPVLIADIIALFGCWANRIPFILLFGIATSMDLFYERLPRAASRSLHGTQFDVEQTSSVLETLFQQTVGSASAPLRLGPRFISALMERHYDHIQSAHVFAGALKYVHMFHYYANPFSILSDNKRTIKERIKLLQPSNLQAIRELPSFRDQIDILILSGKSNLPLVQKLLGDNLLVLQGLIEESIISTDAKVLELLRKMFVLGSAAKGPVDKIEVYIKVFSGTINESAIVRGILDSLKRMSPDEIISFIQTVLELISKGCPESDLEGWLEEESELNEDLRDILGQTTSLAAQANESQTIVRSSYSIHSKGLRTTVIAQRVQLSYDNSTLSTEDHEFTALVDRLLDSMRIYLTFDNPQKWFLRELWLFDSTSPHKDVLAPRPRFAIENALLKPSRYLVSCDPSNVVLSTGSLPTAILYNMYLESGSLVNIADLWTSFLGVVQGEDEESCNERSALMLFYRGLADLKLLGMIKQSKKKTDHVAKSSWRGL